MIPRAVVAVVLSPSLGIAVIAASAQHLLAQQSYAVPDAPAFTFLGVTPNSISRPGTARQLAVGQSNSIDSSGCAEQGIAIDFAPWFLIPGVTNTRSDYQT